MKLYLDTNIVLAMMGVGDVELSRDVSAQIEDYSNLLYTSTVCVHEIINLSQIGKISLNIEHSDIRELLSNISVEITTVNAIHLNKLIELPLFNDHRDPMDRLIIAQAIADRVTLVSSDTKMERYCKYGLQFVFNKR